MSSHWYVDRPEAPVWNYIAVQVRGTLDSVDDGTGLHAILDRAARIVDRIGLDGMPEGRTKKLLPYISG